MHPCWPGPADMQACENKIPPDWAKGKGAAEISSGKPSEIPKFQNVLEQKNASAVLDEINLFCLSIMFLCMHKITKKQLLCLELTSKYIEISYQVYL